MAFPNRLYSVNNSTVRAARDVGQQMQNWGIMVVQEAALVMLSESENLMPAEEVEPEEKKDSKALIVIGWFSIGMAVAALGIFIGAELRNRYKFKKRTPYDFYANAGESQAGEFGVGI
jgi:hypothetical protein